jgi:RNA polymerase sigma factor (sigma-70 family)
MTSPARRVVQHIRQIFQGDLVGLRDGQLLQRFATLQDEQAFAILVQRHGPLVLGVCRRILQSVHDAEDAFQATFLVLARRASAIRKPDSLASWLYEVAYRLARKMKADASKRRQREEKVPAPAPVEPVDPTGRELHAILDEELQRLSEKYRQPLLLCYLEGMTQEEAAGQLGWPRGTLKRRLERGRELLKGQLSRRGVGLGAAIAVNLAAGEGLAMTVPAALGASTWKAAALFAGRQILPARLISARVIALAETALKSIAKAPLKILVVLALTVGLVGGATVFWTQSGTPGTSAGGVQPSQALCGSESVCPAGNLAQANSSIKQAERITLVVDLPQGQPTVSQVNDGQYKVTVQMKNTGGQDAVVWPYFSVEVLDAKGEAVPPARVVAKYSPRLREKAILEEMDFITLKPGQAHGVEVNFNLSAHDPETLTGYQLPGKGEYTLHVHYLFDQAEIKKRFGDGCKDLDNPSRPWNRAVQLEKQVEVRIQVAADDNEDPPQARNPCPPPRRPAGNPLFDIFAELQSEPGFV